MTFQKGTVVIVSPIHWNFTWQTSHDVASAFAQWGYRVIFLEPLPKRWPKLAEIKRVWGRISGRSHLAGLGKQEKPEGMVLVSPHMLPDVGRMPQFLNQIIFVPLLKKQLSQIGLERPLIMVHHVPIAAALALQNALKPDVSVYRCVYDWSNDPHSGRLLQEKELLQIVDEVWADCEANVIRTSLHNNNVRLMLPGVDLSLFADVDTWTHTKRERPLCVYFGTIGISVDVDLLRQISYQYPLRLVGPTKQKLVDFAKDTEMVGAVLHEDVPAYIMDADILLLPYIEAPHMQGVIPAKLFECLVTGKPIISIGLTSIDAYKDLIYICETKEEFLNAIEMAQNEAPALREARIACAQKNSMIARFTEMETSVNSLISNKRQIVQDASEKALLK